MSFLIAINGTFSPYVSSIDHYPGQTIHPVVSVESVSPSHPQDFSEVLKEAGQGASKVRPKIEAYQKSKKEFDRQRKREYAHDIMTAPVHMIQEHMKASEAEAVFRKFGHRHMPVINSAGTVLGMASDRDLFNQKEHTLCIDVMSKKVIVADEHASINELAIIFLQEKLNAIPIINRKHETVGIVTLSDILKYVILNTGFLGKG